MRALPRLEKVIICEHGQRVARALVVGGGDAPGLDVVPGLLPLKTERARACTQTGDKGIRELKEGCLLLEIRDRIGRGAAVREPVDSHSHLEEVLRGFGGNGEARQVPDGLHGELPRDECGGSGVQVDLERGVVDVLPTSRLRQLVLRYLRGPPEQP